MSAISKFTASLLAGSQETTLALAALNFDFSLYKVEAPVEYQGLGASLSNARRTSAESGLQHITARKLGALFRSEMPKTPKLINAYGRRASEIAQTSVDPQLLRKEGVFSEQIGIDGTSIWAAATSGPEALGILLLACMLARFWSAQEATSIWVEIVEARKQNLRERDDHFDFPEIAALQATITRDQLAEWDASARAWLRTADHVRSKQQTQLRLIVENIQLDVSEKPNTYESVIHAWTTAMTTIDKLVGGVAQSTQNGSVLLGLSAWHLYPDMAVYENGYTEVKQEDPLISIGGLLTIGLENAPNTDGGVRWSLPLAKLRYYGEPVVASRKLDSRSDYVSFRQVMFIALGSLMSQWQISTEEQEDILEQISLQWRCIERSDFPFVRFPGIRSSSWLRHLVETCEEFISSKGAEKQSIQRLVAFGKRRSESSSFVSFRNCDNLIFGLRKPSIYIGSLVNIEDRIAHLRKVARSIDGRCIIMYQRSVGSSPCFATAVTKSTQDLVSEQLRWATSGYDVLRPKGQTSKATTETSSEEERVLHLENWSANLESERGNMKALSISSVPEDELFNTKLVFVPEKNELKPGNTFSSYIWPVPGTQFPIIKFDFFYGNPDCAALYRMNKPMNKDRNLNYNSKPPRAVAFEEIKDHLKMDKLDLQYFLAAVDWEKDGDWRSLRALGALGDLYSGLPHAKISMDVTTKPLTGAKWATAFAQIPLVEGIPTWYSSPKVTRAIAFSCIARMETGDIDLIPAELERVMALSISDSLFLAKELVSDPSDLQAEQNITRVLGNIGKPGLSLLIPPGHPMVRKPKISEWNLVNHLQYDGKAEDSFQGTSLHLSLTEYRVPYTTTHEGARDLQVYFQEAVVSIYDRSVWVADVNILEALSPSKKNIRMLAERCPHNIPSYSAAWPLPSGSKRKPNKRGALSIADSWFELLDRPDNAVIVRSTGNWLGRLAAAALSAQLGNDTFIVPVDACRKCFGNPEFFARWAWGNEHVVIY